MTKQARLPVGSKVFLESDDNPPTHCGGERICWTIESYEEKDGNLYADLTGQRQYKDLDAIMNGPGPLYYDVTYRADLGPVEDEPEPEDDGPTDEELEEAEYREMADIEASACYYGGGVEA